jgi:uncharacterized phage-associated protein
VASVFDVANLFVYFSLECGDEPVTNLRLNKLLWFAQGHALARFGTPLFDDNFVAWDYGAVVPAIYQRYKYCGKNPIAVTDDGFDPNNFAEPEIQDFIVEIANAYNKYSTSELVKMSHEQGSPWFGTPHSEIIPPDKMQNWFARPEMHLKTIGELWSERGIVPLKALPADYYDPDNDAYWEGEVREIERQNIVH